MESWYTTWHWLRHKFTRSPRLRFTHLNKLFYAHFWMLAGEEGWLGWERWARDYRSCLCHYDFFVSTGSVTASQSDMMSEPEMWVSITWSFNKLQYRYVRNIKPIHYADHATAGSELRVAPRHNSVVSNATCHGSHGPSLKFLLLVLIQRAETTFLLTIIAGGSDSASYPFYKDISNHLLYDELFLRFGFWQVFFVCEPCHLVNHNAKYVWSISAEQTITYVRPCQ